MRINLRVATFFERLGLRYSIVIWSKTTKT